MSAQKMKAVKPAYDKPKAKAKAKPKIKFEAIKPELRAALQRNKERYQIKTAAQAYKEKHKLADEKPTQTTHKIKNATFTKTGKMTAAAKRAAKNPMHDPCERVGEHQAVAVYYKWQARWNHTLAR